MKFELDQSTLHTAYCCIKRELEQLQKHKKKCTANQYEEQSDILEIALIDIRGAAEEQLIKLPY